MSSSLLHFQHIKSTVAPSEALKTVNVLPFKTAANTDFMPTVFSGDLGYFKSTPEQSDNSWRDYLLIGVLSIVIHGSLVSYFKHAHAVVEELVEPVKVPPKVQITLLRPPPPKPTPVLQPPPPPKVVALKPPPKKLKPKPVLKPIEPPPVVSSVPVVESPAPVTTAAPVVTPPPVVEIVTEPKAGAAYLHNPSPEYPEIAMERGLAGKVMLKVHVQPNGKPDSVAVSKSSGHSILDEAAIKTVKQWSFVPAMRGKTPIAGWVTVPIAFNLEN